MPKIKCVKNLNNPNAHINLSVKIINFQIIVRVFRNHLNINYT